MRKLIKWFGSIPVLVHAIILFSGNIIAVLMDDLVVVMVFNLVWFIVALLGVISQLIDYGRDN